MKKLIRITTVPISLLILLRSQLRFMADYYEVVAVSSGGPALKQVAKETGIRTLEIEMTREITPFKDVKALWKLYLMMKLEKPHLVHTHTPKAGLLGMIASKLAGVPVRLHTVAGMPLLEKKGLIRKILDMVERLTYSCATKVYPNSALMRQIIIKNQYCRPDKLKVIGNGSSNGIDTTFFDPDNIDLHESTFSLRESLNIDSQDIVYCFVGRIVADKGINELVEAFDAIARHNKKVKLLLLGNFETQLDPLKLKTEELISNHPDIIWVDFQMDVRPYFAISDIFVFPSYREGFPNVVMQSGAMGLPSIVTDINGCNEIIIHGQNGIVVPPKDALKLQDAMEQLVNDDTLRLELASRSRALIINRYDQQFVWNELLKEYQLFN